MNGVAQQPLFRGLEQTDFQKLEHAASLKGILFPFKGKGALEECSRRCASLRAGLIDLAQHVILPQARVYPFALLPVQLGLQTTSAGTAFLRWRTADRSSMGVGLWVNLIHSSKTPPHLLVDLYAMEQQRIALNMQISLLHSIAKQADECASKMALAQTHFEHRISNTKF
jgi:hypothetical protein